MKRQEFRRCLTGIKPQPKSLTHTEFLPISKKGNLFLPHVLLVFTPGLCRGPHSPPTPDAPICPPWEHWSLELQTVHLPRRPLTRVTRLKGLRTRWARCFPTYCSPCTPLHQSSPVPRLEAIPAATSPPPSTSHVTFCQAAFLLLLCLRNRFGTPRIGQPLASHTQPHGTQMDLVPRPLMIWSPSPHGTTPHLS